MGKKKSNKEKAATATVTVVSGPSRDVEIEGSGEYLVNSGRHGGVQIVQDEEKKLSRALSQRHIQMIALAGAIVSSCSISRDTS